MGVRTVQEVAPTNYREPNLSMRSIMANPYSSSDFTNGVCYRCGTWCGKRFDFLGKWYGSTCIERVTGHEIDYWILVGDKLDVEATELREARKAFESDWQSSCLDEQRIIEEEELSILKAKTEASKWFSEVGKRVKIEGQVTAAFGFPTPNSPYGEYGFCTKLILSSGERLIYWNVLKVKTPIDDRIDSECIHKRSVGSRVSFAATIKNHSLDREGYRQTVLSRAAKVEIIERVFNEEATVS